MKIDAMLVPLAPSPLEHYSTNGTLWLGSGKINVSDATIGIYMNLYEQERTEDGEPHISKIK